MAALIDIIGAGLIAGLVLLSIFGLGANLNQASYEKSFTYALQTNAVTVARIMESDIVKIGYHIPKGTAITSATASSIAFKADLANVGVTNVVRYTLSSTTASEVNTTINPRDVMLYREVDGSTIAANLGVTNLQFAYYDSAGTATTTLAQIRSIYVKISLESPERIINTAEAASDTAYPGVFWEKTIYPRNL